MTSSTDRPLIRKTPLRVLHVVGRMHHGGTETWLLNVLKRIDSTRMRFDFLVHDDRPGPYDEEIRRYHGRQITCPLSSGARYLSTLTQLLRREKYDVVHTHVAHFSGLVLASARTAGVPVRVVHLHLDCSRESRGGLMRRLYQWGAQRLVQMCATHGLAASVPAAKAFFGAQWQRDPRWQVLHCGIDIGRQRLITEHLPAEVVKTIIHVGRLDPVKNHALLLDAFHAAQQIAPVHRLVLAGDGPLRSQLEARTKQLGLSECVQFLGAVGNVPELLRASDLFVFPSFSEGLGLAAVEAQGAGIPCFISDRIPAEAVVVPPLIRRLSLSDSVADWGQAMVDLCHTPTAVDPLIAWKLVADSPFNIDVSVRRLTDLYESAVGDVARSWPMTKAA